MHTKKITHCALRCEFTVNKLNMNHKRNQETFIIVREYQPNLFSSIFHSSLTSILMLHKKKTIDSVVLHARFHLISALFT